MTDFSHDSLQLLNKKPLVYTAMSKHMFFNRIFISKFVLENSWVPLNPFLIFDYFLWGWIERNLIREANNNIILKSDEIWVFWPISNGVLAEILIAKEHQKIIRYFHISPEQDIQEIWVDQIEMEENVKEFTSKLL